MLNLNNNNQQLFQQIAEVIQNAKNKTAKAINSAMVEAYWHIGKIIVEDEQQGNHKADYGKEVLKNLSEKLNSQFGGGFTMRNLRYMRSFYIGFPKWNAVRSELSWTHYRLLLKVEKTTARNFYLEEAIKSNWSTRLLERQINSSFYERILLSQDKQGMIESQANKVDTNDIRAFIKDPYVLEFLEIPNPSQFTERELETALLDNLQSFLLELGQGFSFVARQQRISADNENFYIDLVFYNYLLKCFVLIDLKVGKLTHQDIGQMDMYVRMYNDLHKIEGDNPTIGIILCKQKNEIVAKYSVLSENEQIFASKYQLHLPTEAELAEKLDSALNKFKKE